MTDLEISKALALAIGWPQVLTTEWNIMVRSTRNNLEPWRYFDYRNETVAFRIAEKYDCFPEKVVNGWTCWINRCSSNADTPQKAIALVVIEGVKE